MVVEHDREELVATLRHELALRNREIARLHDVIASQANAIAQATAALPGDAQSLPVPQTSASTRSGTADRDHREAPRESIWQRLGRLFTG